MGKEYTVVLDLDQTIISGEDLDEYAEGNWESKQQKFKHSTMPGYYIIFERPHLQEFLKYVFQNFNVIVWTAASKDYALHIIEHIILKGHSDRSIDWIFYTYHCDHSKKLHRGVKDLRLLYDTFDLPIIDKDKMIFIDDNEEVYQIQPEKVIHIPPFEFTAEGSENDAILSTLIGLLRRVKKTKRFNAAKITQTLKDQFNSKQTES